jgi:tripartite-type tricarboxylate transporter receptor subunit TctC
MTLKLRTLLAAVVMTSASLVATASEKEVPPGHTFKIQLAVSPGSTGALNVARYGECFRKHGYSLVPDYAPGAEGVIAARKFKSSQDSANATNLFGGFFGFNVMSRFPEIDLINDFESVGYYLATGVVMIQKAGRWSDIKKLQQLSQTRKLNIGYITLSSKILAEIFADALNLEYQLVPYKTNANMIVDIVNENIDLAIDVYAAARSHITGGIATVVTSTFSTDQAQKLGHLNVWHFDAKATRLPLGAIWVSKPSISPAAKNTLVQLIEKCDQDPEVKSFLDQTMQFPTKLSDSELKALVRKYANYKF